MPSTFRRAQSAWVFLGCASLFGVAAHAAADPPLLWQTETSRGYNIAAAVASGNGYTAVAGQTYSDYCTQKGCGYDALLQVQAASTGAKAWTATFDLSGALDANVAVAISGNVVVTAGYSEGEVTSGHLWEVVSAYDLTSGTLLWRDTLGDASTDYYPEQMSVSGGQVFVTGDTGSTCATLSLATCRQFTRAYAAATGAVLFSLTDAPLKGGAGDEAYSVSVAGSLLFLGGSVGTSRTGAVSPAVRAYDVNTQALVWQDMVSDPDNGHVYQVAARGSRLVATMRVNDNWLIRSYDAASGRIQWSQTYSLLGNTTPQIFDSPYQVAMDDMTVVVAGYGSTEVSGTESYPGASRDWVVRAYDAATGQILWTDHSGLPTVEDEANGGVVLSAGNAYVLGFMSDSGTYPHTVLRAYNARNGQVLWNDVYQRSSEPFESTPMLSAADGLLTSASYAQGRQVLGKNPPDSYGEDINVRTYSVP